MMSEKETEEKKVVEEELSGLMEMTLRMENEIDSMIQ